MIMVASKKTDGNDSLITEVKELRLAVDKGYRAFRHHTKMKNEMAHAFLKGVLSAIGAMVAVVIVTPLVIWTLQSVAWPPLIADLLAQVILQYEQVNRQSQRAADGQ